MKGWLLLFSILTLASCQGEMKSPAADVVLLVDDVLATPETEPAVEKAETFGVDEVTGLIKAPGFEAVAQQCIVCHSAKLVTQNRGERAHWESMIRWMQKTQGLWELPPATENEILDYLSTHYGPMEDGRRPALPTALKPPSAPRAKSDPQNQLGLVQIKGAAQSLMGALKAGLKKGAPSALNACHQMAAPLTAAAASNWIILGRNSAKLRNPENTAPSWVVPLREKLSWSVGVDYLTHDLPKGRLGIVKAIRMKAMCLTCHGSPAAAVQVELERHYPDDRATGYKLGDFRGVFWAEVNAL